MMEHKHEMQPQRLRHPTSAVTGQPFASVRDECKNGCGLVGQFGDWTKSAGGVRYWNSTLRLEQIPCTENYPVEEDKDWKKLED